MTYADKKRIADLDEFWDEANSEEPLSSVYLHVYEGGRLAALATVVVREGGLGELSADVAPHAVGRGLGSAVLSAAGGWILAAVGLLPLLAGALNICVLAPLLKAPFSGSEVLKTK